MKRSLLCLLLFSISGAAWAAPTADIIFVVDESGSMSQEHAWISGMVTDLETALVGAGITGNRYGMVGYGRYSPNPLGHSLTVGTGLFGTAAELSAATGNLITSGSREDGWEAMDFGWTTHDNFRKKPTQRRPRQA